MAVIASWPLKTLTHFGKRLAWTLSRLCSAPQARVRRLHHQTERPLHGEGPFPLLYCAWLRSPTPR
jgi:hypothetical protein